MSKGSRAEVNLEITTGFFRISTADLVYNITVLEGPGESGARHRPEYGQSSPAAGPAQRLPPVADLTEHAACPCPGGDDYYKQVSTDVFNDIGRLAKSLSSTIMNIPAEDRLMKRAELDEAGEKIEDAKRQLQDIVSMTEKATMEIMDQVEKVQRQTDGVKDLLSLLKNHRAFQQAAEEEAAEAANGAAEVLASLREKIDRAVSLAAPLQAGSPGSDEPDEPGENASAAEAVRRTRYLFSLDTIFQTMYELCTNETVKTHITGARKKAEEIFAADVFIDALGRRIRDLAPDSDNFFTVSLADILQSLLVACSDPKVQNLLKKMDLNQKDIFLDQSLPLEVPPSEEVEEEGPGSAGETASGKQPTETAPPAADPRVEEIAVLLAESRELTGTLELALDNIHATAKPAGLSMMSLEDQQDIFVKIEDAFHVATSITDDVTRITEALSFQDLSGQQIMKIIKLLSDFQVQLLAIVVSFGSQLKVKEKNAAISVEESKRLAQEDVDRYLKSMTTEEVGGEGALDQAAVNEILEELGF